MHPMHKLNLFLMKKRKIPSITIHVTILTKKKKKPTILSHRKCSQGNHYIKEIYDYVQVNIAINLKLGRDYVMCVRIYHVTAREEINLTVQSQINDQY